MLKPVKNSKGFAVFEMIPIILVIILMLNFSLGFFGAIHTGILNSIAARNYAFETFRNRADLNYLSGINVNTGASYSYHKLGQRAHGIRNEDTSQEAEWLATSRLIDFFEGANRTEILGNTKEHQEGTQRIQVGVRNESIEVNPIWIKTAYGICLNASCSGSTN